MSVPKCSTAIILLSHSPNSPESAAQVQIQVDKVCLNWTNCQLVFYFSTRFVFMVCACGLFFLCSSSPRRPYSPRLGQRGNLESMSPSPLTHLRLHVRTCVCVRVCVCVPVWVGGWLYLWGWGWGCVGGCTCVWGWGWVRGCTCMGYVCMLLTADYCDESLMETQQAKSRDGENNSPADNVHAFYTSTL